MSKTPRGRVMSNDKRKPFPYDKERMQQVRLDRLRIVYQFRHDISQAMKGDTAGLCDYLRSDLPMTKQQREAIAMLLERRVQTTHNKVGRPRGSSPTPTAENERLIVHRARKELVRRRRTSSGKRLPKGTIVEVIHKIATELADDMVLDPNIDLDNIL